MSKINAVRLINLNYNNNSICVSDETFWMNGESTLLALRNGGGKSVLVQMMTAPFVHRRYQGAKDRPFAGYFTTNRPTFILVEWKLDGGAGYVLTGMMVRRSQEIAQEQPDELEMINFIAEYRERCAYDIVHLPVVERTKKDITLKGFHVCRQLFESYKREPGISFFYYDMNNPAQSRQYFHRLTEYQINDKEWESIIKKVNLKESGLSDLFADCRDEKGLVEKWFLEAVENKLNRERSRMKEFQGIMEKYTGQYRDNRSKIERRDTIRVFCTEAERVKESASAYLGITGEAELGRRRIAVFLRQSRHLREKKQLECDAAAQHLSALGEQIAQLEYERLSGELYAVTDREQLCGNELSLLQTERDAIARICGQLARAIAVSACARQREELEQSCKERDAEQYRLQLCAEKEADLLPMQEQLGAQLGRYYRQLSGEREAERSDCEERIGQMEEERRSGLKEAEDLRAQAERLSKEAGAVSARLAAFDDAEERFCRIAGEEWHRNILGEYEAGVLSIRQAEYDRQLQETEHRRLTVKREIGECRERQKSAQRLIEDQTAKRIGLLAEKKERGKTLAEYGRELDERRVILQYFDLGVDALFDTNQILKAADRRLAETDITRRQLERGADALRQECRRLERGGAPELSEEFLSLLEENGIHAVFGMDWLKKNSCAPKKNREWIAGHPFLPYSLLLSKQEMNRLAGLSERVCTPFPVPVIIREELESVTETRDKAVYPCDGVSFYVWFDGDLLEEEHVKALREEKEEQIAKLEKAIARKKKEYTEYIERQEKIRGQKVSESAFESAKEELRAAEEAVAETERALLAAREEQERLETLYAAKERELVRSEQDLAFQNRRLQEFSVFCQCYEQYLENQRLAEKNRKETERVKNRQKLKEEQAERLGEQLVTTRNLLAAAERALAVCAEKRARYERYLEKSEEEAAETDGVREEAARPAAEEPACPTAEEAAQLESRYEAVTGRLGAERRESEARLETAQKRCDREREELLRLGKKYGLTEEDWRGVRYDPKEEAHQEEQEEEQREKLAVWENRIQETRIREALIRQEREQKLAELRGRCGREEPMERQEIRTADFAEEIRRLEYEKTEVLRQEKQLQKRMAEYDGILTSLAEYEEFAEEEPETEKEEWEEELEGLTGAELTRKKGLLVRDYHLDLERRREARAGLERILNRMIRMEQFAEEFYQKPLEAMLQLTGDPERVLRQLETTTASYQSLMEKLLVDISMVEREKEKIVELVGDYLREVHENLNKIDHNSTITVRERPVKMLKIELPDWMEQENLYDLRLVDYIDDTTAKGIALLEENKNVQEYLGIRMATKALYDAVVGLGNVQIRLYKIEEQREYPITWADVARNSGGEGFLSAFVILSALLSYMRRDETDLFADRNEGKVLLMDNPFAQTNASHLLKPLMDMAKKTNTQLICLSGLGGESIYNRFDNIYVLNLIAANLRSGMQYLRSEHTRGAEGEMMISSHIEVTEQQKLIF